MGCVDSKFLSRVAPLPSKALLNSPPESPVSSSDATLAELEALYPLTLVCGGLRSHNVMSVLHGAHSIGQGIFGFLNSYRDANNLRLVCRELRDEVAAFPWSDKETCVRGSISAWRASYPCAVAVTISYEKDWPAPSPLSKFCLPKQVRRIADAQLPLANSDFRFFRGLHYLDVSCIQSFSDAAFSHLSGLKYLNIRGCTQLTDAIFPHLVGLRTLKMSGCTHPGMTGAAFEPLRGSIQEMDTWKCSEAVRVAAGALVPLEMAEYFYEQGCALDGIVGRGHLLPDGREMNQRQLYLECLRSNPQHAGALSCLAASLDSVQELLTLPSGQTVNVVALCLLTLRYDSENVVAYRTLASVCRRDEQVQLHDGRMMRKRDLLFEAIRFDPRDAWLFCLLAEELENSQEEGEKVASLPDGRSMSPRELYLEVLRIDPANGQLCAGFAYSSLGDMLAKEETLTFPNGQTWGKKDVYLEALRTYPEDAYIHHLLARCCMSKTQAILLPDGRSLSQTEMYLEVIRIDPSFAWAYCDLACDMPTAEATLTLPDGRTLNRRELYFEVLRLDPSNVQHCADVAYTCMGDMMAKEETLTFPNGLTWGKREVYLESLRLNPRDAHVYYQLAWHCLSGDERIILPDGRSVSETDIYLEVFRIDPSSALALNNLACDMLTADERLTLLDGRTFNRQELFLEALHLCPRLANPYNHLGRLMMSPEERMDLPDGRSLNQRELYLEAINLDPNYTKTFENLARSMADAETSITLRDGRAVTREQLLHMAEGEEAPL